jgi:hypothetical protein
VKRAANRSRPGGTARRTLLRAGLAVAATRLGALAAQTEQKFSKAAAEYQDTPKNGLSCAACSLFRAPRSCAVVEGEISPQGWCRFFDLPD